MRLSLQHRASWDHGVRDSSAESLEQNIACGLSAWKAVGAVWVDKKDTRDDAVPVVVTLTCHGH